VIRLAATTLVIALAATPAEVEQDGVAVAVTVKSHIYEWAVTNHTDRPITSFEIEYHRCYQHVVPLGWTYELIDRRVFRARAESDDAAIRPGGAGNFRMRAASGGNALGTVPVRLGLGADGEAIVIDAVWGPVPKPRSLVVLVAVLLSMLAVAHALVLHRTWSAKGK
jgi:hypothetical protein